MFPCSPMGGTLPGRRRSKNKPIKDSGSSGPDTSRKSERTKSREKIARKPSKELLRIQNYTDSSDEDFQMMTRKDKLSRRSNSNSNNDSPYTDTHDRKEDRLVTDGASSKTDIASSLSPSSSKRSPNISRHSSKTSHSPKKSSRRSKQSPETQRRKTPPPPTTKSLNMQIKDFIKHSSPPRARKISESSNSHFDAFNHTSSSKLSHASFKEHERSPSSKQSSVTHQYSSQYSGDYDDYEYYHPRRSSKEVLDFTSSRKSLQEGRSSENEQLPGKRHSQEDKHAKPEETYFKRLDEHQHCQCPSPSPRKETNKLFNDVHSPSLSREDKEVFDFTSKKLVHYSSGTLTRKSRTKENKVDIMRKDLEIYSSPTSKSSRKKEDRNVFDFSVADGSEYATLKKKRSSGHRKHRDTSDYTTYEKLGGHLDVASGSERKTDMDFAKVEKRSINNSQELLNIKSSTEFLVSKSSSKEFNLRRPVADDKAMDPWPETPNMSLVRQKHEDYDSLGDSPVNSKDDISAKESLRDTIDPPDLFNTNKPKQAEESGQEIRGSSSFKDADMNFFRNDEPIYMSTSGTLRKSHKQRSKRIRNRSLEMVIDDVDTDPKSR